MDDEAVGDTPEARMAVFRRLVDLYARADVDALDDLVAADYVGYTAAGPRDRAEFRQSILNFHQLFDYAPDAFTIEDQFVDGDRVATRMTAHVRDRRTRQPMSMMGINLAVIRGGKILREWNTWEILAAPGQGGDGAAQSGRASCRERV